MNHKSIDINQRIPLGVLHTALVSYLDGEYSEEYVLEQLRLDFKGENRLKKSLRIVNKIIIRNPLNDFILDNKDQIKLAIKNKHDRYVILISLLNSVYSFSFDTLQFLGKYLSVQDLVNRETIRKALSSIYGGNRATENAIDSVIPMFLEAGFIDRPQPGVYKRNLELRVDSLITKEIYEESFKVNKSIELMHSNQLNAPYFLFLF